MQRNQTGDGASLDLHMIGKTYGISSSTASSVSNAAMIAVREIVDTGCVNVDGR